MDKTILGPNGAPLVELGGAKSWKQRQRGDIIESFQWLDLEKMDPGMGHEPGPTPCMVLFCTHLRMEAGAFIIQQVNAHLYATNKGGVTPFALNRAKAAACQLGFTETDSHAQKRILDVILDGLPDLVRMPSEPPLDMHVTKVVLGIEGTAKINGKTIAEILQ